MKLPKFINNDTVAGLIAGLLLATVCIGLVIGIYGITVFILMTAWNFLIPAVFGGPVITFWQTFAGLIILSFIGGLFRTVVNVKN